MTGLIKITERDRGEMWLSVDHIATVRAGSGGTRIEMDYTTEGGVRSFLANEELAQVVTMVHGWGKP